MNEKRIDFIRDRKNPFRIGDIAVFVLAVVLTVVLMFTVVGEKGDSIEILYDGERIVLPLYEDANHNVKGKLTVAVKNGKCSVVKSECRNKTCVKTGEIYRVGESIVCAQFGVIITVIGYDKLAGSVGRG